jgi:hypothetical protein
MDDLLDPNSTPTRLILNHWRLQEVPLALEIDHLRHPRERVVGLVELLAHADLLAAALAMERSFP